MPNDPGAELEVRKSIVECFVEAQFSAIEASAERLGLKRGQDDVRKMIEIQVREAFSRIGADYDHPRKADFAPVMEILAAKAAGLGQDSAVIEKHKAQMLALVSKLRT